MLPSTSFFATHEKPKFNDESTTPLIGKVIIADIVRWSPINDGRTDQQFYTERVEQLLFPEPETGKARVSNQDDLKVIERDAWIAIRNRPRKLGVARKRKFLDVVARYLDDEIYVRAYLAFFPDEITGRQRRAIHRHLVIELRIKEELVERYLEARRFRIRIPAPKPLAWAIGW